ncbi:magnesium transporter [Mycena floridula]|nr:magnesium transporter [Mycena floridula]
MFGQVLLSLATLAILHAAFSTYEHLSHLKALGRPEGALPTDIVVEVIVALALGILGASVNAPPLKEITWASEMKKRSIDEMDARTSFASYVNRGRDIFGPSQSKSS